MDLGAFEQKIYSQNGEDGITMKLVELLYDSPQFYVEFGVQDGSECNTRILREKYKWNGLQMDGGHENESIQLRKEFIMKENIVALFQKYNVPRHIQVLCVDIDFNDFYCLNEILKEYQCDIIICEYNGTHFPNEDKIVTYDPNGRWDYTNYFGASLRAFYQLGLMYKYTLVYCNQTGVNCFLVRDGILRTPIKDAGDLEKLYRPSRYGYGPNGGHCQDPYDRPYLTFEEAIKLK